MRKLTLPVALVLAASASCVSVNYQGAGEQIRPRAGQTLLFGRVRFFHDGREFFPWAASLTTTPERHLWLLRLGRRATSAELHPDGDGSLAIWLASGDYALLGSTELLTAGTAPYEVVALFRIPAGAVAAYAGELTMSTESHEGGYWSHGELGAGSVTVLPLDIARATLEQRLGALPEAPARSPWCAGDDLPGFNDSRLAVRAKEILDRGCASDPALVAIYSGGDTIIGHLMLGASTAADAARIWAAHGGLGAARDNDVVFRIGSTTLRPEVLYTPPRSLHQLYFHNETLVLVVTGTPHGVPSTRREFMRRFPTARETQRESTWYELQTPLDGCIWLIGVFGASTDTLESSGVARTCEGKQFGQQ